MKKHYTLTVDLTLEGPILTVGGETAAPGIDAPMSRDRHGRWMIPFSLVKGKVLDAVSQLREADFERSENWKRYLPGSDELKDWLGIPSQAGSYDPERGRLHFSDFHTLTAGDPDNVIERIEINSKSGAVASRMLMMAQAPFGYGETVTFTGTVEFIAADEEAKRIKDLLDEALRWTPAYGAFRTIGYGRTKAVATRLAPTGARLQGVPPQASCLPMTLAFDRPLCLVGRKHAMNHFESLEVVSGTVLKGALARMIQEYSGERGQNVSHSAIGFSNLRKYFDVLRISEARPRCKNASASPVEPPLSIVTCPVRQEGDVSFFDAALEAEPRLIRGAAPAFQPDWKGDDWGAVRNFFGWPSLPRQQRTRTAIDPDTGRAADEQLFSYGVVLPDQTDSHGNKQEFVWDCYIGLENVDPQDQVNVRQELAQLLNYGITGIGKTRAVASVTWTQPIPPAVPTYTVANDLVIITLQTECLMGNPETLRKEGTANPLEEAYCEYWQDISQGSLELVRYFARQSLYGGFVSQRVQRGGYEPFLLTDRGSTFVLSVADHTQASKLLADWKQQGLPNAAWMTGRYSKDGTPLWRRCPYIRENGYGEVAINLECHFKRPFPSEQPTTGAAS